MNLPKVQPVRAVESLHDVRMPSANAADVAARGLVEAFRGLVREVLSDELARLKHDLMTTLRPHGAETRAHDADAPRLLSVAEVAARVGATPATVREWIKDGHLPAMALGPAGRKYAIRWSDVEASMSRRKRVSSADIDAEASHIVGAARARVSRRRKG